MTTIKERAAALRVTPAYYRRAKAIGLTDAQLAQQLASVTLWNLEAQQAHIAQACDLIKAAGLTLRATRKADTAYTPAGQAPQQLFVVEGDAPDSFATLWCDLFAQECVATLAYPSGEGRTIGPVEWPFNIDFFMKA